MQSPYYWVTVRNSHSYWHLEHMRETLAWGRAGGDWMGQGLVRGMRCVCRGDVVILFQQ